MSTNSGRSHDRRLSGLAAAIVIGLVASGALVWHGSEAAFTASTQNPTNSWASGSVALSDNDSNGAMFNTVTGMVPNSTGTKCITVSYTGSVTSNVKMYAAAVTGSAVLASDIDLVISTSPTAVTTADPTCAGTYTWTPVYSGTLNAFNGYTTFGTPAPLTPAWTTPAGAENRAYKIVYTLKSGSNAQGLTTGTTFTWEAQNT